MAATPPDNTFMRLTGGLVEEVQERILRRGTLSELMPSLETRHPVNMLIPRSAIAVIGRDIENDQESLVFLCELPFGIKNINKNRRRYRLAMPWTYFIFGFVRARDVGLGLNQWMITSRMVFHSPRQIQRFDEQLWVAFLPNVDDYANICFGNTGVETTLPLHQRVDRLVTDWYLTEFNNDLISGRRHPFPYWDRGHSIDRSMREWVDATTAEGASVFLQWPEFTDPASPAIKNTVEHWMQTAGMTPNEIRPIAVEDALPAFQIPATYGRIEQFFGEFPQGMLHRARTVLETMHAETPERFEPAPVTPPNGTADATWDGNDGGVPITEP